MTEQHERTFRDRFRAYPFRIESLSRFKTAAESKVVLADLAAGKVDVVIGTHRILSKDVAFADLGLVIVDEEQRFGVEHKQRLLAFRLAADVLTLSATPIPRTLHMSLLGIRDISSLTTAPLDRRAIVTEVIPWNPRRIQQAIRRELARQGQVFFVHNRVNDIEKVAAEVQVLMSQPADAGPAGTMEVCSARVEAGALSAQQLVAAIQSKVQEDLEQSDEQEKSVLAALLQALAGPAAMARPPARAASVRALS